MKLSDAVEWVLRHRLQIIFVVIVLALSWALAVWLTPYRPPVATIFWDSEPSQQVVYVKAEVTEFNGSRGTAKILEGTQRGRILPIQLHNTKTKTQPGSIVLIVDDSAKDDNEPLPVMAPWRLPVIIALLAAMIVTVVLIGGRQGIMSLAGLTVSIGVIAYYIVPSVLGGANALLVSTIGAFAIATLAVTIGHRLRWRTLISLLSIYVVLVVVVVLAMISSWAAGLTGIYDETSSYLRADGRANLDVYGILLGGIIIAALGVLDDVVTTQVAAIDELWRAKPHATRRELWQRGMSVGREHLSALINTLALAYVGVALPTILIMSSYVTTSTQLLLQLNSEMLSVEVIRTVVASMGLILAIPLCTGLAVLLVDKKQRAFAILKRVQPKSRR